jgi:hypothetical protein
MHDTTKLTIEIIALPDGILGGEACRLSVKDNECVLALNRDMSAVAKLLDSQTGLKAILRSLLSETARAAAARRLPPIVTFEKKPRRAQRAAHIPGVGTKSRRCYDLLIRSQGVMYNEMREATGWPSVSMPTLAKTWGLKIRQEGSKGTGIRYWGTPTLTEPAA